MDIDRRSGRLAVRLRAAVAMCGRTASAHDHWAGMCVSLAALLLVTGLSWRGAHAPISAAAGAQMPAAIVASVTETPAPAPTDTPAPTATVTPTSSPTATPTTTATTIPTETPTIAPSATSTATPTPTETSTPTDSPTPAPSSAPTRTPTRADSPPLSARVPILMYHHVTDVSPGAGSIEKDLSVSPARFAEQLAWLRQAGFETISVADLARHLTAGAPLPEKPIILSFDDGYTDNYTRAFALLKEQGLRASFFVLTDFVDHGRSGYMTWPQIEEMARASMEIGSHSRDHPDLRRKPATYLVWQILGSRQTLEAHLGPFSPVFCYPSGKYDAAATEMLRSAGYVAAVTSDSGVTQMAADLLRLKRVRVRGGDSLAVFTAKLGY